MHGSFTKLNMTQANKGNQAEQEEEVKKRMSKKMRGRSLAAKKETIN